MTLQAGAVLQNGKYKIEQVLGQGSFGITYQGVHVKSNQRVVIKTLSETLRQRSDVTLLQQQFLKELQRLSRCVNPQLPRVLHSFEEAGVAYGVMEWIPGTSLAELAGNGTVLPEAKAIPYIRQAAMALATLHENGLLHRDVKPQNLILHPERHLVVLVDVGVAREYAPGVVQLQPSALAAGYAALEQYLPSGKYSPATDIYALAATLYYLLTGQPPIAASFRLHSPFVNPRQLQPSINPVTEQAILRGMEVEAVLRSQTLADWLALLPMEVAPHVGKSTATGLSAIPTPIDPQPDPTDIAQPAQTGSPQPQLVLDGQSVAAATVQPPVMVTVEELPSQNPANDLEAQERARELANAAARELANQLAKEIAPTLIVSGAVPNQPGLAAQGMSMPQGITATSAIAPTSRTHLRSVNRKLTKTLGITAIVAIVTGMVAGVAIRLQMGTRAGFTLFNPVQSFPAKQWPGQRIPEGEAANTSVTDTGSAWFPQPVPRRQSVDSVAPSSTPSPAATPAEPTTEITPQPEASPASQAADITPAAVPPATESTNSSSSSTNTAPAEPPPAAEPVTAPPPAAEPAPPASSNPPQ